MIKPANTGTISDYKQGLPQMNDVLRGWFIPQKCATVRPEGLENV